MVTLLAFSALTACTGFRIEDDDLVEGTEQLTFSLASISPIQGISIGDTNQFVLTITDNDGKECTLLLLWCTVYHC